MKSSIVRSCALLGVLAVASCGADDPAGVTADLSDVEAQELAGVIFSLGFLNSLTLGPQAVEGPARVIEAYTETVQTTAACPSGGAVDLDATLNVTFDTETGASSVGYSIIQTHNACVGQGDQGTTFTLNGNPNITFDLLADTDVQSESTFWSGGINGSIAWETSGRSGTCSANLEYSGSSASQAVTFSLSGTICGASISRSFGVG
jgi:hypothetical protein